jgi:hypothetical protein
MGRTAVIINVAKQHLIVRCGSIYRQVGSIYPLNLAPGKVTQISPCPIVRAPLSWTGNHFLGTDSHLPDGPARLLLRAVFGSGRKVSLLPLTFYLCMPIFT